MEKDYKVKNKQQLTLIIMCWAVYTFAYLGRYGYNSNVGPITEHYGIGELEFAIPSTFFFFAYGVGQILHGIMCKWYNLKFVIPIVLVISAILNILIYFGIPFGYMKYLWLINGICQSVLWPSLLLLLSQNLDENHIKTAVVAMSTTVSIGTVLAYGASGLFAIFSGFRYSFLTASICMAIVSVIWLLRYNYMVQGQKNLAKERESVVNKTDMSIETERKTTKNKSITGILFLVVLYGAYAIITNFIKDGLHTWVPKILKDNYRLPDSLSIILTLVLPIFGVFGATVAVLMNRKIKSCSDMIGLFFMVAALCMVLTAALFETEYWLPILILFGIITMCMHGSNNAITSILPLAYGKKYNAGLLGGLLNGACYVGSTLSQIIVAAVAEANGWFGTIKFLMYLCFTPIIISVLIFVCFKFVKTKNIR